VIEQLLASEERLIRGVSLFNDAASNSAGIASNALTMTNNELERTLKEVVVDEYRVESWHLLSGTQKSRENLNQSNWWADGGAYLFIYGLSNDDWYAVA
jgi:chlorite dismutase